MPVILETVRTKLTFFGVITLEYLDFSNYFKGKTHNAVKRKCPLTFHLFAHIDLINVEMQRTIHHLVTF